MSSEERIEVHKDGPCHLSISSGHLMTWSPTESMAKSWPSGDFSESHDLDILGEIRSIVTCQIDKETKVIVATDQMETEQFEWPGLAEDSSEAMFRFASDVTCLSSFSLPGRDIQLAAGSGDFKIKYHRPDYDQPITIVGHEAPILSIGLDPHGDLIVSSSCDGTLRVWNTSTQNELHQTKLWPRSSDVKYSKTRGTVLFDPSSGDLFAVQCVDEVKIFQRSDYGLFHSIDQAKVNCIAWSHDGLLLAAGSQKEIKIYNTKSWMPEKEIQLKSPAIDLDFDKDRLFIGEESGHCTIIPNLNQIKKNVTKSVKPSKPLKVEDEMEVDDEEDEPVKNGFVDDEAGEDDVDDLEALWEGDEEPVEDEPQRLGDDSNTADISLEAIKKQTKFDQDSDKGSELGDNYDEDGNEINIKAPPAGFEYTTQTKMQQAFQPSSTPTYQAERFLCWNGIGIVKGLIDQEKGISSIVVEFHNIQTHHSIQLQNKEDFTMSSLSDTALILASGHNEENEEQERSIIKVLHYKTWWDKNKEWTIELPKNEYAECVCASSSWVAVATSERVVRVFSTSGAQIHLASLPGPVCTISANQEQLFYTYHRGAGFDENQLLSCGILTMDKSASGFKRPPTDLALSPRTELAWVGYTDEGTPAYVDTEGLVRIVNWNSDTWMPIASTKKAQGAREVDTWWITSINEGNKDIYATLCKNSKYPSVFPRPELEVLRMNIPLINPKSDISVQEADLMVTRNLEGTISALEARGFEPDENMQNLVQKQVTKTILKMLLGAIQQDADDRGYEICTMFENPQQVQMAIKLANQKRRPKLAERLVQLARQKDEEESEEEESDDDLNEVVENGFSSQNSRTSISQQFNSKARIDTDSSSRHSEDLFQPSSDMVTTKTINPFSKSKPTPEVKEDNPSSVFDSMAKPEIKKTTNGGMPKRDMRKKLADLRNKSKKASKEQSDKKHESILSSFGKRKHSTEDENTATVTSVQKKQRPDTDKRSALANMDQFAASDED